MFLFLYSFVYLVSLIPRRIGLLLGDGLGLMLYLGLNRRRTIALNNLALAFGSEKGLEERKAIVKKSFRLMGRHFFETCYLIRVDKEKLGTYVRFEGVEHYEEAKALGRGVVLLTGHFGCWELLAVCGGYFYTKTYLVTKPMDFVPMEKLVRTIRGVSGNECISKEKSMRKLIEVLREQSALAILLDQNIDWYDGVFVPFFNELACTNKGLALLVRKTKVPVVPLFIIHEGKGRYRIEVQPPLPWIVLGDKTKEIEENTAQYNLAIEAMVRKYPDHYFWVHQRWKTRPYQPWPREKQ